MKVDRRPPPEDIAGLGPVAVMDGTCAICTVGARWLHRFDTSGEIRICPIQTDLGRRILAHYDVSPDDPETWIFIDGGQAYFDFDATIRIGERSGGWGRVLSVFRVFPQPVRDWLYRRLARNRYRLFGRADICAVPDARFRDRLIG